MAPLLFPLRSETLRWRPFSRMLGIGLPIGLQILFEYGVFGLVGFFLGRIGSDAVAGHQIALNYAAITFMVPLGVGAAAAALVGRSIGAGDSEQARRVASAALVSGALFMAVTALVLLALPGPLASLYSPDLPVVAMAAALIPLAGVFQIFDGTQAVALGVLRGVGDTRVPVVINILGYYGIGLPIGLWLANPKGMGPIGFWWGLVMGLAAVALILVWRVRARLRGSLARVDIER